jgi:hypothetical protein
MAKNETDRLLYVLVGCAGIGFLGLCAATGVGLVLFTREGEIAQGSGPGASPAPGFDPASGKPPFGAPGAGPAGPQAPVPVPRLRVAATVRSVRGGAGRDRRGDFPLASGATCLFDVQPPDATTSMCRAQVVCGGQLLFGGENAGYFPCTVAAGAPPSISGRDDATTGTDHDAAMTLDTGRGLLTVEDDERGPYGAFTLEARIDSVE